MNIIKITDTEQHYVLVHRIQSHDKGLAKLIAFRAFPLTNRYLQSIRFRKLRFSHKKRLKSFQYDQTIIKVLNMVKLTPKGFSEIFQHIFCHKSATYVFL